MSDVMRALIMSCGVVLIITLLASVIVSPSENQTTTVEATMLEKITPKEKVKVIPPEIKRPITDNVYILKYAGEYVIEIEGVTSNDIEKYILRPDGACIWKWETGGYPDTKYGTWTAEKGRIRTVNRGRTGDIPEEFTYKNGKFRSEWGNDRVLIKVRDL